MKVAQVAMQVKAWWKLGLLDQVPKPQTLNPKPSLGGRIQVYSCNYGPYVRHTVKPLTL